MNRIARNSIRSYLAVLLLVLASWSTGATPAESYAPINDLIGQVDQLRQAGQIFDVTTASNLIVSLQTIGTLVDAGNRTSANQLLSAFNQEVNSMSGALMTPTAASQLVSGATSISTGL